ncbi:hypothetical protein LTR62_007862 [Meristemomyces frigidus]|uniref:Uncharacterized protein n=1 Tax=Meristemomyces frigidus TaxID=1508187 RepID=A0AAN7TE31_9PEZI|nr:hypothetical protein LTR62_007862 [Meristemomyces frigidus]
MPNIYTLLVLAAAAVVSASPVETRQTTAAIIPITSTLSSSSSTSTSTTSSSSLFYADCAFVYFIFDNIPNDNHHIDQAKPYFNFHFIIRHPHRLSSKLRSVSSFETKPRKLTRNQGNYGSYGNYGAYGSYGSYSRSAEAAAEIEALLELAHSIKSKRDSEAEVMTKEMAERVSDEE